MRTENKIYIEKAFKFKSENKRKDNVRSLFVSWGFQRVGGRKKQTKGKLEKRCAGKYDFKFGAKHADYSR